MDFDSYANTEANKKYAAYRWQDEAVNYAKSLGFAPNKAWFRFFKTYFEKNEPRFRSIMEKAVNPNIKNKEKYFYWMYHNENRPKHTHQK